MKFNVNILCRIRDLFEVMKPSNRQASCLNIKKKKVKNSKSIKHRVKVQLHDLHIKRMWNKTFWDPRKLRLKKWSNCRFCLKEERTCTVKTRRRKKSFFSLCFPGEQTTAKWRLQENKLMWVINIMNMANLYASKTKEAHGWSRKLTIEVHKEIN